MANEFLTRNEEIVDGIYRLGTLIKRSPRSTVYETEFGDEALPAVIKMRESDSVDPEDLMERWRNARELEHPNLLKVYASGSSEFNGVPIVYVVMERADESLDGVLAERALTGNETREMLEPALAALKYLHNKGYAHSRLAASNVLAVDDQLKLSSDSAIRVNDKVSTAEDMRALGVLIVQALTQKIPYVGGSAEPYLFQDAPQPFRDIVQHCLDPDPATRWTVEQVEARLKAPAAQPISRTSMPRVAEMPAVGVRPPIRAERPVRAEEEDRPAGGVPKWIYAGVAALVLLVILVAVMRRRDSAPQPVIPAPAVTPQVPRAGAAVPARPERILPRALPSQTARPAVPPKPSPIAPRARGRKDDGWSVIIATYNSREAAEKRMHAIAKRWPNFNVNVFHPQSDKAHYVVQLGQNLSEDQAEALRKRAIQSGLPGDAYIKRLL